MNFDSCILRCINAEEIDVDDTKNKVRAVGLKDGWCRDLSNKKVVRGWRKPWFVYKVMGRDAL